MERILTSNFYSNSTGLQAKSKRTSRPSTSTSPKLLNNSTTSHQSVNSAPLNLPPRTTPLTSSVWTFIPAAASTDSQQPHSHQHQHIPTASTSQLLPPTSISSTHSHSHNHSNSSNHTISNKLSNPSTNKSKPKPKVEDSTGSCPGGGICNGQGGKTCCEGCPAFNNRVMYKGGNTAGKSIASSVEGSIVDGKLSKNISNNGSSSEVGNGSIGGAEGGEGESANEVTAMECFNCHTRKL